MSDSRKPNVGGHHYPGCSDDSSFFTSDCDYGCGCWMGGSRSGGPDGVDPFGSCPNNLTAEVASDPPPSAIYSLSEVNNPASASRLRKVFRSCDVPIICPGCMKEITAGQVFMASPQGPRHEGCLERDITPPWVKAAARRINELRVRGDYPGAQPMTQEQIEGIILEELECTLRQR